MLSTIVEAIRNKEILDIGYEPGARLIEPHCLGHSADGNILLRAYQISGASASGEPSEWKLFRLDRMFRATSFGQKFRGPRTGYNPNDPAMKRRIIARL
ncbi:WYL domain-containing protein [Ancylobacter terrae]|uniref:WYL domain-containing protein n=1 Tax=Ancylobacter sp. sgz301288 TaxID=3342077 RepID=UPI00385EE637